MCIIQNLITPIFQSLSNYPSTNVIFWFYYYYSAIDFISLTGLRPALTIIHFSFFNALLFVLSLFVVAAFRFLNVIVFLIGVK